MIREGMQSLSKFPFHFFFRKLLEDVLHQHDIITQERGNGIRHQRGTPGIPRVMVMGSSERRREGFVRKVPMGDKMELQDCLIYLIPVRTKGQFWSLG